MFSRNIAYRGGTVFVYDNSNYSNSPSCTFQNNIAHQAGGAVLITVKSVYSNS